MVASIQCVVDKSINGNRDYSNEFKNRLLPFYQCDPSSQFSHLIDKIRSNDPSTEELYLDCSNLGIATNDNKTLLYLSTGLLKLYIRSLSLAMSSNTIIRSVHLDTDIFRFLMGEEDEKEQKQQQQQSLFIVQFFMSIGKIPKLKHLDVYSSNKDTTAPFKILWLTSALESNNNFSNNLESLRLSRLNLSGSQVDFNKFERAMQALGCSTKKIFKTIIFHLVSVTSLLTEEEAKIGNTTGRDGGLDQLLKNTLAMFPSQSSLENIAIIANEPKDNDDDNDNEEESHNKSNKRRKIGEGVGKEQQKQKNNDHYTDISSDTIELLCKIRNLKRLSLSGFALSAENLIGISHAIANPKSTLEYLDLSNNGLADRDFLILGYAMELACENGTTKLQGLKVSHNDLKHKTGAMLAHILTMEHIKLRVLDMSDNNIGNDCEGCLGIGKSLFVNESLEVLNLNNCFVEDDTIMGMASSILFGNTNLQSLNISNNVHIEQEFSYQVLAEAIEQNHSIKDISMENVSFSSSVYLSQIQKYCVRNKDKDDGNIANKGKKQKLHGTTSKIMDSRQEGFIEYNNKDRIICQGLLTPNLTTNNLRRCASLSSFATAQKLGLESKSDSRIENDEKSKHWSKKSEDDCIYSILNRCRSLPNIQNGVTTSILETFPASPQSNPFLPLMPSTPLVGGGSEERQIGTTKKRSHESGPNKGNLSSLSFGLQLKQKPEEHKKNSLYSKKGRICGVSFSASIAKLTTVVKAQACQDDDDKDDNRANATWDMSCARSSTTNMGPKKVLNGTNTTSIFSGSVHKTSAPLKSILSKSSLKSRGSLRDNADGASNNTKNISWSTIPNKNNSSNINNTNDDKTKNGVMSSKQYHQMKLFLLAQQQKAGKKNKSVPRSGGRNNSNLTNAFLSNTLNSSK